MEMDPIEGRKYLEDGIRPPANDRGEGDAPPVADAVAILLAALLVGHIRLGVLHDSVCHGLPPLADYGDEGPCLE
jgi:hypothetical protein